MNPQTPAAFNTKVYFLLIPQAATCPHAQPLLPTLHVAEAEESERGGGGWDVSGYEPPSSPPSGGGALSPTALKVKCRAGACEQGKGRLWEGLRGGDSVFLPTACSCDWGHRVPPISSRQNSKRWRQFLQAQTCVPGAAEQVRLLRLESPSCVMFLKVEASGSRHSQWERSLGRGAWGEGTRPTSDLKKEPGAWTRGKRDLCPDRPCPVQRTQRLVRAQRHVGGSPLGVSMWHIGLQVELKSTSRRYTHCELRTHTRWRLRAMERSWWEQNKPAWACGLLPLLGLGPCSQEKPWSPSFWVETQRPGARMWPRQPRSRPPSTCESYDPSLPAQEKKTHVRNARERKTCCIRC